MVTATAHGAPRFRDLQSSDPHVVYIVISKAKHHRPIATFTKFMSAKKLAGTLFDIVRVPLSVD